MPSKKAKKSKRGPEPERVKTQDNWVMAVRKALKKPRPAGGWPKEKKG